MDTTDFLPIGSVVLLIDGTKKLMITGFCTVPEETPDQIYDYCGCLYPEGVISSDEIYVFDHDQIQEILFIGYEDDEQQVFMEKLVENVDKMYEDDDDDTSVSNNNFIGEEIERL